MMLACMIPFGVGGPVGATRDHGPVRLARGVRLRSTRTLSESLIQ